MAYSPYGGLLGGPGYIPDPAPAKPDPFKQKYGTLPDDPTYESLVDENGNLKSQFTMSAQPDVGLPTF
jgi:hypothetical protein